MTSPAMVIDLGEVRHAPAAELPPAPSLLPLVRRGFAALGAAAALLAAGAAAPVRGHLVEVILPVSATDVIPSADAVYVSDRRTVARYELPDGRERWRVPVPFNRAQSVFAAGEVVLVTHEEGEPETLALDGETGERRWRRPGSPSYLEGGQVLLSYAQPGDITARFDMVDVATGVVRWQLADPDANPTFYDDERFVRWSPTGRVEVRDLGTGRMLASGAVPPPDVDAVPSNGNPGIQIAGDLLLVARMRAGQPMADAYDLKTFVRRWTAALNLGFEYPGRCGDALCVSHLTGAGGVRVLEPDTGRVRWSNDQLGWLERIGPVMLSYGIPEQPPRVLVLDSADGHLRADLGRWEIGWPIDDHGRAVATRVGPGGDTWIGELDLIAGTTRILGVARDTFGCRARERVVTCQRSGGTTGIWYPRRRLDE